MQQVEYKQDSVVLAYDLFMKQQIDSTDTPGAAVAVVKGDSVVYIKAFGLRNTEKSDSVDLNTQFRLASVSKGFAGVLAALLHRDSVMGLDTRIIDVVPGFELKDSLNTHTLTLAHSLSHTAGLVPHAFDNLVEANDPMSKILPRFKEVDIAAPPGKVYSYQNAMFSIFDTMLRAKTNKAYSEHLKEKLFTPLGMKNANTEEFGPDSTANFAHPHSFSGSGYVPIKLNTRYYNAVPAAGVNASISDMAIWLKALLGSQPEILDSLVLESIATPLIYTPLKRRYTARWGKVDNREYSLGWRIYTYMGKKIIYHGGYVRGYRAEISFCPQEKTGVVYLQNAATRLASMSMPEFWKLYFQDVNK